MHYAAIFRGSIALFLNFTWTIFQIKQEQNSCSNKLMCVRVKPRF